MKVNLKKAFSKKRLVIVIILLALVSVMALSNPDLRDFFLDAESVRLDFKSGTQYDALAYGKNMLLVNNEGLRAVDKNGQESFSVICATTNPALNVRGDYILLCDMNGKSVRTFRKEKTISQIETKNEILCAKVNKNGYVAVATNELGYKGLVTFYDKGGAELYKWHSGQGYIGDIDISSSNKIAVSQIITNKEEIYSRLMIISPDAKSEPVCISETEGIITRINYRDDGSLVAVSEKGLYGFKKNGKPRFTVSFEGRTPIGFNIENERNMVFALDSGLNNTVLESYSASGKLRGSYSMNNEIKALDVNGECIVAVSLGKIVSLNPKGNVKKEIRQTADIQKIKIFAGRERLLSLGGSGLDIIKFR